MIEKVKAEVKSEWEDNGDEQENCIMMEGFFLVGKQEEKNSHKNKQHCGPMEKREDVHK